MCRLRPTCSRHARRVSAQAFTGLLVLSMLPTAARQGARRPSGSSPLWIGLALAVGLIGHVVVLVPRTAAQVAAPEMSIGRGHQVPLGLPLETPTIDQRLWGVDGSVYSVARSGNTLYIGGIFSSVGPCTGGGVPLSGATGAPLRPFPRVCGTVLAAISDGEGGLFIGGRFTAVEGVPHANLAHILADGSLAPWDPTVGGIGGFREGPGVDALALRGHVLYIVGLFTSVNGQTRNHIAALDAMSGTLTDWNPNANDRVRCLAMRGRIVFVGGDFTAIGGRERHSIAAIEIESDGATDWNPDAEVLFHYAWGRVRSLVIGGRIVYAGGDFDSIDGQPRNSLAAIDAETGHATSWDAKLGPLRAFIDFSYRRFPTVPFVASMTIHGHTLYAGGWFNSAGGEARGGLAAFDIATGTATPWNPDVLVGDEYLNGWVSDLAVSGNTVYVGGQFLTVGGQERPNVAAVDAISGHVTSWNPRADGEVDALFVSGSTVYAGGSFVSMYDWVPRNCLAALDVTTGAATSWNPEVEGPEVRAVAAIGDTVYIGGAFGSVNGQPRMSLAAVHGITGALVGSRMDAAWADGTGEVTNFTRSGDRLYVGGDFATLGGYGDQGLCVAAIDLKSMGVIPWSAHLAIRPLAAFAASDTTVYIAGHYYYYPWVRLTAVSASTGALSPWNPLAGIDEQEAGIIDIASLAVSGNTVYVGGGFGVIGGQSRNNLAAVDAITGLATRWNPDIGFPGHYPKVLTLLTRGDLVYAGGVFTSVGGQPRDNLAALDAATGLPMAWAPDPDGTVLTLVGSDDTVYAGGEFRTSSDGFPHAGLIAFADPTSNGVSGTAAARPVASAEFLAQNEPNPVRGSAAIRFTISERGPASLTVYDLQGRRIATLVDHELMSPGVHEVQVRAEGWRPGCYLYRIETGGKTAMRKMVVVR